jgi:hypothetical protein
MVTPELIKYIREELAKGKTRDEVHNTLDDQGGWSEADISEGFRVVAPSQDFSKNSFQYTPRSSKAWLENVVFIVVGLVCVFAWWFYSPQIVNFWGSSLSSVRSMPLPSFGLDKIFGTDDEGQVVALVEPKEPEGVVDCGVGIAPSVTKDPSTYQNDPALICLGESAFTCENAEVALEDDLFPDKMEIVRGNNSCHFKLSYAEDSILIDSTGQKLAGQYVSCPIQLVKTIDDKDPDSLILAIPDRNNLSKYTSQIYFYGTLGLFLDYNLDADMIREVGCTGPYIDSVIAGYQTTESQ